MAIFVEIFLWIAPAYIVLLDFLLQRQRTF